MFQFEKLKVSDFGPCECCGDVSRRATGMVRRDGDAYAIYHVDWTTQQVARHGAEFYLLLGRFGEGTTAADKFLVALHFFIEPDTLVSWWLTLTKRQWQRIHWLVVA